MNLNFYPIYWIIILRCNSISTSQSQSNSNKIIIIIIKSKIMIRLFNIIVSYYYSTQ